MKKKTKQNKKKKAKYYPVTKQVYILRKFCTVEAI